MKVLLGGIPLGCNNIGDEAIIACVVKILKSSVPGIKLTVATQDKNTASLGVKVVPAFGFDGVKISGFKKEIANYDAFIWCGATGLSDYPHIPLKLLDIAQKAGKATFIWGVGMDDELNPVFFKVRGKRRFLLKLFGLVGVYENWLKKRLVSKIKRILPKCQGVWLRDEESREMLGTMGYKDAKLTADSAIFLRPSEIRILKTKRDVRSTLGLCISTQRQVKDLEGVKRMIANVRRAGWEIIGLPMNPKTDRKLLESLLVWIHRNACGARVYAARPERYRNR